MSDIFLSYSSADRETARLFAESFERRGFDVWWDPEIRTGKPFADEIAEALEAAKCVVVLWSQRSTESLWVKDEAGAARKRGVLAPVLIDDAEIPLGFKQIQATSLPDWDGDESLPAFQKLVVDIGEIVGREAKEVDPNIPFKLKPFLLGGLALIAVIAVVIIGLDPFAWRGQMPSAQVCITPGPTTWDRLPRVRAPKPATLIGLELTAGTDTVLEDYRQQIVFVGTSETSEALRSTCKTALNSAWISLMPEDQRDVGNTRIDRWINNARFVPQIRLGEGDTLSAQAFTYTTNPKERVSTFARKKLFIRRNGEMVTLIL